jgi:protoporphyrinogen IX oxidase
MSLHEILKTLHITAVMMWVGPMILTPIVAVRLADERPALQKFRTVAGTLMAFSMVAALGFGLATAAFAGWFGLPWVHAKLAVAVVLAAMNGVISGQLRRTTTELAYRPPHWLAWISPAILVLVTAAIFIAVAKPF